MQVLGEGAQYQIADPDVGGLDRLGRESIRHDIEVKPLGTEGSGLGVSDFQIGDLRGAFRQESVQLEPSGVKMAGLKRPTNTMLVPLISGTISISKGPRGARVCQRDHTPARTLIRGKDAQGYLK